MRISTAYQYGAFQNDVTRAQEKYFEAQQLVSTGKRINRVSDDPHGAASSISLRGLKAATQQYANNLDGAKTFLNFTENALDETNTILSKAYELAVSGANASTDQNGRNAMVSEVDALQRRLLDIANTQGTSGQYIFAGQKTDTKPFTVVSGTITYNGDQNPINSEVSPTDTMTVNTDGSQLYTDAYNKLEELKNNLLGGDLGKLSGVSIPDLQSLQKQSNTMRGTIGGKISTIGQLDDHLTRRIDEFTSGISDVEDVDMADAITQFQLAQNAYQAALTSVSQASKLSLMDFMR